MTELNRRTVLAGAIAAGAAATFNPIAAIEPAKASTPLQGKQAPGWYRVQGRRNRSQAPWNPSV